MRRKVVSADEAIAGVRDGDTLCCSGFGSNGVPVELILALEKRFGATGGPKALTLFVRLKPGEALGERGLSAHIYETQREALESAPVRPEGDRA